MIKHKEIINKNMIKILILILLILLFFIFINFSLFKFHSSKLNSNLTYVEVITSKNSSNCNYLNSTNLIQVCKLNLNSCSTDLCFLRKAKLKKDLNLCSKIKDLNLKGECLSSIHHSNLIQSAVNLNNVSLCNNFKEKGDITKCKDNYYYVTSINTHNKSLCFQIKNEEFKNECQN